MAEYTINEVHLRIPDTLVTGQLDRALSSGRYEHSEAEALLRHLRPRDRFLDLGAGAAIFRRWRPGWSGVMPWRG